MLTWRFLAFEDPIDDIFHRTHAIRVLDVGNASVRMDHPPSQLCHLNECEPHAIMHAWAKIEEASLADLVKCYKLLKDKEDDGLAEGKVKGLLAYLIQLEREDSNIVEVRAEDVVDGEFEDVTDAVDPDLPKL